MSQDSHYRKLESMYLSAPINHWFGSSIKVSQSSAEVVIPMRSELYHPAHAVHGAVYFKALDDAAFFSASSVVEDVFLLTTSFTTYMTRPISSGEMRAVGKVVNVNRLQIIAEAVVYDSNGKEIARGSGVFVRSSIPLTADIGYQ